MYREIGLLCVLLLPVLLVYIYRSTDPAPSTTSKKTKKKKKNKKSTQTPHHVPLKTPAVEVPEKKESEKKDNKKSVDVTPSSEKTRSADLSKPASKKNKENQAKVQEVDEHMDPTPQFARVMRIKTEEEEYVEPVPYEEGWDRVEKSQSKSGAIMLFHVLLKKITQPARSPATSFKAAEPITKKQRENMARAAKRKEEKARQEALQAQRLRQHQKELERLKINDFYSKGAGKNTPWGKKSSSKTPTATASLNEHGQLIWD
ncbi:hypothetical protein DFQ28_004488 [Apophysomyces sp. BC1034]|nr:hypothetical protein DFQ30_004230 [Apophysomyces sp. BC1015]KAG0178812.1 hypothetical protein DFQ29_002960 [Apophysomyces sp. BC1021]KAG0188703.1 hypothetical protein DFQ28_004488 [Apophysomyces sp. BC1034]